jgi:hypothetical protein
MFAAQHVAGYDVIGGDGRNRISSAVHSTTLPPLRGRKARHKPDRARFLHEGERSRQAGRLDTRAKRSDPQAAAAACAPWRSARASETGRSPTRPAPRATVRPAEDREVVADARDRPRRGARRGRRALSGAGGQRAAPADAHGQAARPRERMARRASNTQRNGCERTRAG